MKKLNLRKGTTFDYSNEADTEEQRINFYCISEGPTEESYFHGIRNNKKELHIKMKCIFKWLKKKKDKRHIAIQCS